MWLKCYELFHFILELQIHSVLKWILMLNVVLTFKMGKCANDLMQKCVN
jgi:hypothetical protein